MADEAQAVLKEARQLNPGTGDACLFHSWVCPLDLQDRVTGKARTVECPRK